MDKAYEKWLSDCLKKFNKKYEDNRKYTSNPDGRHDHRDVVEFDEDGNAYVYSPTDGVVEYKKVATPWLKSKYYLNLVG